MYTIGYFNKVSQHSVRGFEGKFVFPLVCIQYFSLGFFPANLYLPIIIITSILIHCITRIKKSFNASLSQTSRFSWYFFLLLTVFIYFIRWSCVNLENSLATGLTILSLLIFLQFPKNGVSIRICLLCFSVGVFFNLGVSTLVAALNNGFISLYGREIESYVSGATASSHISFYLSFALFAFGAEATNSNSKLRFLYAFFLLITVFSLLSLGGRIFIVSSFLLVMYLRKTFRAVLVILVILTLVFVYDTEIISGYLNFLVPRLAGTLSAEDGRGDLWLVALQFLGANAFGYCGILNDLGMNSFHNIFLDLWRFGGFPLPLLVGALMFVEMFRTVRRRKESKEYRLVKFYMILFLLMFQLEVIFEALYKLIPLYVLVCRPFNGAKQI